MSTPSHSKQSDAYLRQWVRQLMEKIANGMILANDDLDKNSLFSLYALRKEHSALYLKTILPQLLERYGFEWLHTLYDEYGWKSDEVFSECSSMMQSLLIQSEFNREFMRMAVEQNGDRYRYLPDELKNTPSWFLIAARQGEGHWELFDKIAPDVIRANPEIANEAVRERWQCYEKLPPNLKGERDYFLLAARQGYWELYEKAPDNIKSDPDIAAEVVSNRWELYEKLPLAFTAEPGVFHQILSEHWKLHPEQFLLAARQSPGHWDLFDKIAPDVIRADPEIAKEAVSERWESYEALPPVLKKEPHLFLLAARQAPGHWDLFDKIAPNTIRSNVEVANEVVRNRWESYEALPPVLKKEPHLFLLAARQAPGHWELFDKIAPNTIRSNFEVANEVVRNRWESYEALPPVLKKEPHLFLLAARQAPGHWELFDKIVPDVIRMNREVAYEVLQNRSQSYQYLPEQFKSDEAFIREGWRTRNCGLNHGDLECLIEHRKAFPELFYERATIDNIESVITSNPELILPEHVAWLVGMASENMLVERMLLNICETEVAQMIFTEKMIPVIASQCKYSSSVAHILNRLLSKYQSFNDRDISHILEAVAGYHVPTESAMALQNIALSNPQHFILIIDGLAKLSETNKAVGNIATNIAKRFATIKLSHEDLCRLACLAKASQYVCDGVFEALRLSRPEDVCQVSAYSVEKPVITADILRAVKRLVQNKGDEYSTMMLIMIMLKYDAVPWGALSDKQKTWIANVIVDIHNDMIEVNDAP